MSSDSQRVEDIITHEVGHKALIVYFGGVVTYISLSKRTDFKGTVSEVVQHSGKTHYDTDTLPNDRKDQIACPLAGYSAEGKDWSEVPQTKLDIEQALRLADGVAVLEGSTREAVLDECQRTAKDILDCHAAERAADEAHLLERRREQPEDQVQVRFDRPDPDVTKHAGDT